MSGAPVSESAALASPQSSSEDLARRQRWFRAWETNKGREMNEQRQARQYYHDKQWTDEEIKRLTQRGQQPTVRNRIKRKIDFLVGVEQRLRRDPKAFPRTPQHDKDADTATAALRYACDINHWETVSSEAMRDGLISGIGVVHVCIAGSDPKLEHVHVERFFYDPRSVKADFSDALYMGVHLWLDEDQAADRWPEQAPRITSVIDSANVASGVIADQDREQQWGDFEHRRIRVVELWERRRGQWAYSMFCGNIELEGGPSPYTGDSEPTACPYLAWSPYIDERGDRYGMVRTMKSVQDEINYSASKILHRIAADRVHVREGSVLDPDEMKRQLARPDGIVIHNGAEWGKDIGIIDSQYKLEGEAERYQLSASEIENLGPNPGLVGKGQGVDGASGRALLAQRDSGMTELSPVFERHRDWKRRVYRATWQRCRQAWQGEKWIRLTDESDTVQHIALNQYEMVAHPSTGMPMIQGQNMLATMDVDVILNEGPDTITVNEELLQTLSSIGEAATGPLGRVIIELSNAPNKERLLKLLDQANAPDPQVAAMQQRMAHLEEMLKAISIDKTRADVENVRADTLSKLMTAATPAQQQVNKDGSMGPSPVRPDLPGALAAMRQFPLQFGQPLLEQQAEQVSVGPPPGTDPQQQASPSPQPQPGMGGGPAMPMMMPEQIATAGALPVQPGV